MIQAICIVLSGVLFSLGGYHWLICRRYIMPLVIAIGCYIVSHSLWSLGVLVSIPILCTGYGENAVFTKVFNRGWSRSVWGLIVALSISLAFFCTGHIPWYWFIAYIAVGFTADNALKNLWQVAGDFIVGCLFGALILIVH